MNKWERIRLGDAATFINGYAFKPKDWKTEGLEIIRIQNLTKSNGSSNYYDGELNPRYKVIKGDFLISWSATLGIFEWQGNDAWLNQHIFKVVFDKKEFDKSFFKHLIAMSLDAMGRETHGSTMKHITKPRFDNFQIPYPPLAEQKKIAAILDASDSLRQKDQQLVEHYIALSQSLFLEMFGDPVANSMGWQKTNLGELLKIVRGGSPRPINEYLGGDYPWIKIGDATKGNDIYIEKTKEHIIEEGLKKTRLLPAGSIIFANCGVSLGFARIITFEGCIHDGWLAFSDINENILNKIFLLKALNSITEYFRNSAPDGTQPNLNTTIMKNFGLILPPIKLQNKFAQSIASIEQQKQQAQANLQKSEALFNSLLQRAFTGELTADKAA